MIFTNCNMLEVQQPLSAYVLIITKSHSKKFNSKQSGVPQESFHAHFNSIGPNGKEDWEITLIDQAETLTSVLRKECFWQYKHLYSQWPE